jgi:hypothetical protein
MDADVNFSRGLFAGTNSERKTCVCEILTFQSGVFGDAFCFCVDTTSDSSAATHEPAISR